MIHKEVPSFENRKPGSVWKLAINNAVYQLRAAAARMDLTTKILPEFGIKPSN